MATAHTTLDTGYFT